MRMLQNLVMGITTTLALASTVSAQGYFGKNQVQYIEYDKTGHGEAVVSADRDIRAFVTNRLAGAPFTSSC